MRSSWVLLAGFAALVGAVFAFGGGGESPPDPCEGHVDAVGGASSRAPDWVDDADASAAAATAARVQWSRGTVTAVLRLPENVQGHTLRAALGGRPSALPLRADREGDGDAAALQARLLWRDVDAGTHRLVAVWLTDEPRLQVIDLPVTVAAGERVELGDLAPRAARPAQLRLQPAHAGGAWFTPAQLAAAGLATAVGQSWIAELPPIQLPLGRPVPVDGLSAEPLPLRASYGHRIRLDGAELTPQARASEGSLRLGLPTEIPLQFAPVGRLGLSLRWPGGHGWVEVHAVSSPDRAEWRRLEAVGAAAVEFEVPPGPLLLVASLLDRRGVTRAFALRHVSVDGPLEVELLLEPTAPVHGRSPDGADRVEFALAAWPQRPLWRAAADAAGEFAVAGLPVGPELVLVREGVVLPVRLLRADGGLRAEFGRR
ncbi:MAG: hypothetical protein AB7O97_08420 [Planctomycetota bacterium]